MVKQEIYNKKYYYRRLKQLAKYLEEFEEELLKIEIKYPADKNALALLSQGYIEHIDQFEKEITFYKNMINVLDKMEGVVKGKWLTQPNKSLGRKTPLEVIIKEQDGMKKVLDLL